MPLVVVDAENVRRSIWPNLSREELVARARAWAAREGHKLRIVFDGQAPEGAPDLVSAQDADDEIVRRATSAGEPFWVATSDRELRARLGDAPERVIGGGTFVRML
jgi:rRNA-processing protein FCF1